jgi:hypothetical protein
MRFRIEFEAISGETAALMRMQGFLPFTLRAMPDVEHPSFRCAFGVYYVNVDLQYDALRSELGGPLDQAAIRWAVAQLEDRLRLGRFPESRPELGPAERFILTEPDLPVLRSLALDKTCEYQVPSGREFFCSAAAPGDKAVVGTAGRRRIAPTSRPICKQCDLPDTDYLCSNLTHPRVIGSGAIGVRGGTQRQLVGAYCEIGRSEIEMPSLCLAGGHSCWTRIVEPTREPESAVPYSPRELPTALDFLNAVWERAFGRPLLRLRSVEKTAALSLGCATHDEFRARLDDLNELFKLIDIPDELLDENGRKLEKQQTFRRMTACLELRITDEAERERISDAIGDFRAMNTVRNKLAHGGAELAEALSRLRIEYPIRDYAKAWDTVRARTAEALTTIRSALQGAP